MPNGSRIRANNVFGIVNDAPLAPGATTFNSNQLVLLPQIFGDHAIITLDPIRKFGEPEIVIVTAHTASSTVATIQRGAYGTNAREHPQDTVWVHAALDEDFTEILTSGTRPTDPYAGQTIFETDTETFVARNAANGAWVNPNMWADPPACIVTRTATQSIPHNTVSILEFTSEVIDTNGMHDNVINNSRVTIQTPGLYIARAGIGWGAGTDYSRQFLQIIRNGGGAAVNEVRVVGQNNIYHTVSVIKPAIPGDFFQVQVFQLNAASAARTILQDSNSPFFEVVWIGRG